MEEETKAVLNKRKEELSYEERESLLEYTKKFIKKDKYNLLEYCWKWNGTNGIYFNSLLPEDLMFKVLGLINEGRRKCYTGSYRRFKCSVYFHVKMELLTLFKCRKEEKLKEDSPESLFTLIDADNYFESGTYADGAEAIYEKIGNKELRQALLELFDPVKDGKEIEVLKRLLEGDKRREIAESLKISVNDVTNSQKIINRRIKKHFNKNLL